MPNDPANPDPRTLSDRVLFGMWPAILAAVAALAFAGGLLHLAARIWIDQQ